MPAELLALIRQLQSRFVRSDEPHRVFDAMLPDLLRLCESEYGFIAEVWRDDQGAPFLKIFTMTNIAWDAPTRAMVERERVNGIEFRNLKTLFGAGLVSGAPVIANDAPNDPRSGGGLPQGHTPLNAFLGVPLHYGGDMVGMIGLANRPGGYSEALLQDWDPLFQTMAGIIAAVQLDRQRRAAEARLTESDERWRRSFELAGAGLAQVDRSGHFIDVNDRMCQITGWPRLELLRKRFQDITHPDDLPTDETLLQRMVAGQSTHHSFEKRYLRPDGSTVWAQLATAPVFDAAGRFEHTVTIVLDIGQRKRAEAALHERDLLFTELTSRVPGVLMQFHADPAGRATVPFASAGLRTLFDLDPDGPVRGDARLMIERVVKGQRKRVWETLDESGRSLQPWALEFEIDHPTLGRRWVEAHGTPQRLPDGGTLWHGYISDITDRKQLDIAMLNARAAERANEAKTEFLSRMSHELRTPLNAVLGFAQLLLGDASSPLVEGQRTRVGHIERAGQHLLAMIGDVLDLSRIEAGSLPLAPQPLSVATLIDESIALVAPTARASGIALLRRSAEAEARLHVRADPMRLRQVLVNLLSNAVKYNHSGGRVVVESQALGDDRVLIAISDTGVGLTPAQQQHLFEPFNRLGAERSAVEGTGLGLAITRRLLDLMAGSVSVYSEPGKGSTFSIELPRTLPLRQPAMPSPSHGGEGAGRHTVLYAEDNRLNVELIEQLLLMRSGCELRIARNGREAIASARSQPPDLLLIDMHLGDMTGLDVLDALRDDEGLRGVPRIALSADALPHNVRVARERGFDDYLTKPVDIAELLRCLDRHLAARRGAG